MHYDLLIVGAGPAGLACAIEAGKRGVAYALVDKGCLVDAIYRFPADMTFFSTPDLLSVGDLIFVSDRFRPNRIEALNYYRAVADHYKLAIRSYERVTSIVGAKGAFAVTTRRACGVVESHTAARVVVATGFYDQPNRMNIPGEDLPKVSHYYAEGHPYRGCDVAIVGGKNSAVEAALTFQRAGARVTMIHRGPTLSSSVKYWVRPDIEKRIASGAIAARFDSRLTAVEPEAVVVENVATGAVSTLKNDFVFALTGYRPDTKLLADAGVIVDGATLAPTYDPATMQTNVPGLYVAGSVAAGIDNNKIFIENSRGHGRLILDAVGA